MLAAAAAALALWAGLAVWHTVKPMPPGTDLASDWHPAAAEDVRLLVDSTRRGPDGGRIVEQEIFDAVFAAIGAAEEWIVADFFLVNEMCGAALTPAEGGRALSSELEARLLAKKRERPEVDVLLVTDPINDVYGGDPSESLERMRAAGIDVVVTDLDRLRDSNPLWSAFWRAAIHWWDRGGRGRGRFANPLDPGGDPVTWRAIATLLNFKANHRKVLACDDGSGGAVAIVTSGNPHDASSAHSNIGLLFRGPLALVVAEGERAVARFSGWRGTWELPPPPERGEVSNGVELRYLTEHAIERDLVAELDAAAAGDSISVAMFYLADRDVISALLAASERGARVRLVLDPNKDAFGKEKDGVPNRQVADELVRRSRGAIEVRWYVTDGEQFHTKLVTVRRDGRTYATLGSANLTRRNLENYNLEANVALRAPAGSPLDRELEGYFEGLWSSTATTGFEAFHDTSRLRRIRYRVMEATGLSTF